jgi:membrane peptidoglycan carboxypeptidase
MSPAPSPRHVLGLLGAFVATSMVAGLLAAGLAIPAVGASGLATQNSVNFFDSIPGDLAQPPLSEKSTLLAADGSVITTFYEENRDNVNLDAISPEMQRAIVAIEDARFYQHSGVDPKGLVRALLVNKISGNVEQGASTLTQQYVKNVLKESAYARGDLAGQKAAVEQTTSRKLKEIRYAVTLEKSLTKDEILDRYLNIAWFGGKINGVEAASKYYFNTHAKDLTLPQAATLAGMVQDPVKYSPNTYPAAALLRRNVVLGKMLQLHMIDQKTHNAAEATKLGAKITPTKNGCANAGTNAWFCDYVWRLIIGSKTFSALGKTSEERQNTLLRGGLTIKTTMSPKIQKAGMAATAKVIPPTDPSRVATAAVTVEPGTGRVLSIAQNWAFDPAGGRGKSSIDYGVDKAYGGGNGFQTGSTFKPFTLATWLKQGKSLNSIVSSEVGTAPFSDFHSSCLPGGLPRNQSYTYYNSEGKSQGDMTVFKATYASVNGAYVSMEKQLDLCDIRKTAEDLGVHLAAPRENFCLVGDHTTSRLPNCVPSLTLGVADISPMTMAAAYAAFAAKGTYCAPIAVASITDGQGKSRKVPGASCKQGLDENVANTVNYGLSHVFKPGGTAAKVGGLPDGRPASGKTGTTNESVNTWFVGYTPQLATAVWVGHPDLNKKRVQPSLNTLTINGVRRHVFGATYAAPIWKLIMTAALRGTEIKHFAGADSKLLVSPKTSVPDVNGKSLADAIRILKAAHFKSNVSSGLTPSKYPAGSVASTSPAGGSRADTGTEVSITLSSGGGNGLPGLPGNLGNGNGNGPGGG